jgi:hypothetical protein
VGYCRVPLINRDECFQNGEAKVWAASREQSGHFGELVRDSKCANRFEAWHQEEVRQRCQLGETPRMATKDSSFDDSSGSFQTDPTSMEWFCRGFRLQ